ncbi:hypothetical protein M1B72_03100 [Geomonas paludis]|uniref:DUF4440 domain-containing protein n=1 Tax=Geomonas paludis TaxID=2740185 RepID=A0ABY4LFE1_9BACT|nr:hypothetical protein [Geomonas paludis]UPU36710.1 hypothetical protein M1B72_03100 [Geomonas paludis]
MIRPEFNFPEDILFKGSDKTYLLALLLPLALLPLVAFASGDGAYIRYLLGKAVPALDESERIKAAVTEFNNRFMDIYASQGDKRGIGAVPATVGMRHSLVTDSGSLWVGGQVLVYDIASLDFRSVQQDGPLSATVLVKEEWNYQYKDGKTYKDVGQVHGTESLMRYRLLQQGGRWLVQKSEPVRESGKEVKTGA